MPLEVNFYAGSRKQYLDEALKDRGGLYALINGFGVYRGAQPVAGLSPIYVTLISDPASKSGNVTTYTGYYDSAESAKDIQQCYIDDSGTGSRPLCVTFNDNELHMRNIGHDDESATFIGMIAGDTLTGDSASTIHIDAYKLKIQLDGAFALNVLSDDLPLGDGLVKEILDRIKVVADRPIEIYWSDLP